MHDVFYFTDIHGQMPLFNEIMRFINEQDPEAMIIFGGDACDRGDDGYVIMKMLLANPQVVYIKGNHEAMFVDAARALRPYIRAAVHEDLSYNSAWGILQDAFFQEESVALAIHNGANPTLMSWLLHGAPSEVVDSIDRLPITFSWENFDFCHAGGAYNAFKSVNDAEYEGRIPNEHDATTMIWDRNCFGLGWAPNRICVHGHTPTVYLPAKFYGSKDKSEAKIHPAKWYGPFDKERWSGLKIDMDTGMTWTGRAWVLNVLTGKAISIFDNEIGKVNVPHTFSIGLENFEIK